MPTTALNALGVNFSVRAMKLPAALLITVLISPISFSAVLRGGFYGGVITDVARA